MNSPKSNYNSRSPSRTPAPLQLLSPLHKATRQLSVHLQRSCRELGIGNPEAHMLTYLLSYGPCPVGELLRVFGHKKSTLTSILDRLESRRYLVREVHPADRRSFLVTLTPAGRQVAGLVRQIIEGLEDRLLRRVAPADLSGFQRVMAAIATETAVELRDAAGAGRALYDSTAKDRQHPPPPGKDEL